MLHPQTARHDRHATGRGIVSATGPSRNRTTFTPAQEQALREQLMLAVSRPLEHAAKSSDLASQAS